ncbi:FAD-dependent oxidoreductase, partial [Mycolicibacter algericus]|uniref:FAD-dependent oxidoreductase n=1 Tax=Mycolicibacter algericus TaxID=1288388 RepID=UPI0021F36F64
LSIGQISRSLREELADYHNVQTLLGEAVRLDADARTLTARRPDDSQYTLDYDYLVIAAGMRQSYFGHEEYAAWAPGMKTLDDALSIRRRLFGAFEIAETLPPGPERDSWLTFAVTGAGPTGVELAGQIRELATRALANVRNGTAGSPSPSPARAPPASNWPGRSGNSRRGRWPT